METELCRIVFDLFLQSSQHILNVTANRLRRSACENSDDNVCQKQNSIHQLSDSDQCRSSCHSTCTEDVTACRVGVFRFRFDELPQELLSAIWSRVGAVRVWRAMMVCRPWRDSQKLSRTKESSRSRSAVLVSPRTNTATVVPVIDSLRNHHGNVGQYSSPLALDAVAVVSPKGELRLRVLSMAAGSLHSVVCTNEGVFSFGNSACRQLGHRRLEFENRPRLIEALEEKEVVAVAAGGGHTVVCTQRGELLAWGNGEDGQLGLGELLAGDVNRLGCPCVAVPRVVDSMQGKIVVKVACGLLHTAVVTATGELYTFGCGCSGQLGHGSEFDVKVPQRVEALVGLIVIGISCGSEHTMIVTDGTVFTFGRGVHNVLGHDGTGDELVPRRVGSLMQVVGVAAGAYHSAAWTESGDLFTWGEGRCGELGHGGYDDEAVPRLVQTLSGRTVKGVAASRGRTVAWTEKGEMLTCGKSLGFMAIHEWQCIRLVGQKVVAAATGSEHTIVSTDGHVLSFGSATNGQLGYRGGKEICIATNGSMYSIQKIHFEC